MEYTLNPKNPKQVLHTIPIDVDVLQKNITDAQSTIDFETARISDMQAQLDTIYEQVPTINPANKVQTDTPIADAVADTITP